ncbi:hypothetical protein PDE_05536 [Penicillium oxalicum 114-2]|uniref:Reverse transcriptase Ty1/copia-type domain-containing protein n=1 Tax=Penicillium oxalicum (strain 114-2 / CGMCC 5302) TaxID=933388 RepID=S7ZJU5_PENO1|nr:hypothetical protein PDE_05536 [Penicillium oxalicum 114-2]
MINVDGVLIAATTEQHALDITKKIQQHFKIKDLGPLARFLGCTISYHEKHQLCLHRATYLDALLAIEGLSAGSKNAIPMIRAYLGALMTKQVDRLSKPHQILNTNAVTRRSGAKQADFPPKHNQTSRSRYQGYNKKLPSQHSKIHRPYDT